ncbi:unnamed protein product [Aphanomyces euteiches]
MTEWVDLLPPEDGTTRVYLCRHGETDFNVENRFQGRDINSLLNEHGKSQAEKLGLALRDVPLDALYCSYLTRAQTTAAAIGKHHNLAPVVVQGLEEMYFGKCEGIKLSELHELWQGTMDKWNAGELDTAWPEGECPLDVEKRGKQALFSVLTPSVKQIALVCHGRFNKLILSSLLYNDMTKVETLVQDNTCINVLDFHHESQTFTPRCINYTGHWSLKLSE